MTGALRRWAHDDLERHEFADILYRFLTSRFENQRSDESFCCAIDGEWGVGKTFFIDNWVKDTINKQHIVIKYDAWKNDHHDDPLINFIAYINNEIRGVTKKLPLLSAANRDVIVNSIQNTMLRAGKAAMPVFASAGKNLALKYIGQEAGDLLDDAIKSPENIVSDKDIEAFLKATFKKHETKSASIAKIKADLERAAQHLKEMDGVRGPIFIVIDELDRCRPHYAISLLEGVKHILSAKGITFVISTNIRQLSESVKALYGTNFDGRRYLRRFFDFEFEMPGADPIHLINRHLENSSLSDQSISTSGIFHSENHENKAIETGECINVIARAFDLDLRSIKQMIGKMEAFLALQSSEEKTNIAYLTLLNCLDIRTANTSEVVKDRSIKLEEFTSNISDRKYIHSYTDRAGKHNRHEMSLLEIMNLYISLANEKPDRINAAERLNSYQKAAYELGSQRDYQPFLASYHEKLNKVNKLVTQRRGF